MPNVYDKCHLAQSIVRTLVRIHRHTPDGLFYLDH